MKTIAYRPSLAPKRRLLVLSLVLLGWGLGTSRVLAQTIAEVTNLQFSSSQTFSWDSLSGAEGYHVYRGTVTGLPSGNYGSCLLGSVQGTSATDAQVPPVGTAFTYLVAGFDASGQGTLGSASSGGPRNPSVACVPARRFLDLVRNGSPGDGVLDGLEPLRNPSALLWPSHRETTGVYLHTGEFFVTAVDLEVAGRGSGLSSPYLQISPPPADWGPGSIPPPPADESEVPPDHAVLFATPGLDNVHVPAAWSTQRDLYNVALSYCGGCHQALSSPAGKYRARQDKFLAAYYPNYLVARSYRSEIRYDGPLGQGWEYPANARLAPSGSDAIWFSGTGRRSLQVRLDATHFYSTVGNYTYLRQNPDGSFFFRDRDGTIQRFHAFDGSNKEGALESVEDREGNRTSFLYDSQGLLVTAVDSLGRTVTYAYNAEGRITSMTDFTGRSVVYSYDTNGNLVSVRSPVVTSTPNGNDFPSGKTTTYTYTSGFADERLNHNLLSIIPPREVGSSLPAVQNLYGTDPLSPPAFDRVLSQTIGGTNSSGVPAGGGLTYVYEFLNPGANTSDPTIPRRKATVTDRNGNLREYVHNYLGHLLSVTRFTNRNLRTAEPDYTTQFSYNLDGQILQITYPAGKRALFTYDPPGGSVDRYREGNLLELRLQADTLASGGRGNGHGGEANDRVWTFTYEPVFNQLVSITDPRGNDSTYVPPNGGTWSPARYTKAWFYDFQEGDPATNGINAYAAQYEIVLGSFPFNLGDLNGDGSMSQALGNSVKVQDASVLLAPGSNQALIEGDTSQDIVTLYRYNAHGQLTALVDPEGNRHDLEYYPETDPDGDGSTTPTPPDGRALDTLTGGYLKTRTLDTMSAAGRDNGTDPTPAMLREDYSYDPVGNLTNLIDGRGVRTRWVVNQLSQVVELRRAAATADASGPSGDPSTGRGESGLTPFAFLTRFAYDANDNLQSLSVEDRGNTRGVGTFINTTGTYDLLDDPVEVQQQVTSGTSLVTQLRYDANQNRIKVTEPAGNAHEWAYDERDLLLSMTRGASGPRGGTPSTRSYSYDGNGNPAQVVDGRGGLIDYQYDGFDRSTRLIDWVGNTGDVFYDPVGNTAETLLRGPVGGVTPPNRSGSTNMDLQHSFTLFDERSRPFRFDRSLFVPAGASPARTPVLAEGPLLPSDGNINTIVEYDRLSRPSFLLRDTSATARVDYDGMGRPLKQTLPAGNLLEWTYDGDSNLIETVETELSSTAGPPTETFFTTLFFDAANRPITQVDNVGQTSRYLYDSLDAVTTMSDARGPLSGSINRRSPGHTGISVSINSHGNVVRYSYDGISRLLSGIRTLTATGEGNGTTTPPPDTTNPNNPDGLVTLTTIWDSNSLVAERQDDKGNQTQYAYDNLDRLKTLTADDGTVDQFGYDAEDNLLSRTEPNGTLVSKTYDPAHRLVAANVTPGSGVEGTTQRTFQYDGLSRLTQGIDNNVAGDSLDNVTVNFIYDSLGRLVEEGQLISDGTPSRTSDLGWKADSLPTDLIYPSGRQIHYAYDGAERLLTVTDTTRPETAGYQYFGLGRVHTRSYGNGIRATRLNDTGTLDVGYDGARRTTLLRYLDPGNILQAGFQYLYDRASNPTSHRRLHHADLSGNFKGELYAYDSGSRLTSFTEGFLNSSHILVGASTDSQTWTLDGTGNWPQMSRAGVGFLATSNNNNEYDEMQSGGTRVDDGIPDDFFDFASTPSPDGLNLTHDKNGSQTNLGLFNLHYDFNDRPVRANRNSDSLQVGRYAYDALGRRVKRVTTNGGPAEPPNETRRYYYALSEILEERDAMDAVVRQVAYGRGERLWQIRGDGSSQYLLQDVPGSAVALASGTGATILERVTYDAYGKPTFESATNVPLTGPTGAFLAQSPNGNPDLFDGMRYDPELGARTTSLSTDLGGLFATRFRYYDPNKGRFTSRDPLGTRGDLGNAGNSYAFAGSNPIYAEGSISSGQFHTSPGSKVANPVTPSELPLARVFDPVAPPDLPMALAWAEVWESGTQVGSCQTSSEGHCMLPAPASGAYEAVQKWIEPTIAVQAPGPMGDNWLALAGGVVPDPDWSERLASVLNPVAPPDDYEICFSDWARISPIGNIPGTWIPRSAGLGFALGALRVSSDILGLPADLIVRQYFGLPGDSSVRRLYMTGPGKGGHDPTDPRVIEADPSGAIPGRSLETGR